MLFRLVEYILGRMKLKLIAFLAAFLLIACGEQGTTENITQINQSGLEVVTDVSMLPPCSAANEGELVWVKNEVTPRMCSGGKWYAVAEGSVAATCTTAPLKDSSGVKILCGGDSIGVVYNGKDGKDGEQGLPGEKGEKGETGGPGTDGLVGSEGADGKDGRNGIDGKDGAPGADGRYGVDGKKGAPGADGKDGVDGKDGTPGADGKDGKDGTDGKDGVGCSMEHVDEFYVLVVCGEDSTVLLVGKLPDTTAQDTIELDSEKIAISLEQVSGVTQKGPFLSGSKVLVREMSDGRTLTQTGNSFNGKILNDNGEFRINARMLVSQYVMLEATGYYRNEVTGKNSNSEITLFAITDVNDRNIVNVNLLTHLEYERVVYLVTQKKMRVKAAKKQAQKEVFGILNIDATGFSNSEDLSVAGTSDEDAALLAFSIVMQGDRSESQLSDLLTKIAVDMEKDGTLDDSELRVSFADWAVSVDSSGRIAKIRENVKNWGISSMVPDFEKYLYNYWTAELELDTCKASEWGKVVAARKGVAARRFICREDGLWHVASDFEKDTYGWKDTTDGALKAGNLSGKPYVFDSTGIASGVKGWRVPTYMESQYGGCNKSLYGETRANHKYGGYFQCQENAHDWVLVRLNLRLDTSLWAEGDDGYSEWKVYNTGSWRPDTVCIVYDTSRAYTYSMHYNEWRTEAYNVPMSGVTEYGYWRVGYEEDCSLGLFGCTEGRVGQAVLANDGYYYACKSSVYENCVGCGVSYYWAGAAEDTYGWACLDSNDGEMRLGQVNDAYYVCEDSSWREATVEEEIDCRENGNCWLESSMQRCKQWQAGTFVECDSGMCVCSPSYYSYGVGYDYKWLKANCAEIATGSLCATTNDSSIVQDCEDLGNFKVDYVCSNNRWHAVERPFEYKVEDWMAKRAEYYTQEMHPGVEYGDDLVDNRDNQVYKTVYIGGKHWMAENLRYADSVTTINLKGQTQCEQGSYWNSYTDVIYDKVGTCEIGARRYSWTAAVDVDSKWRDGDVVPPISLPRRGICPEGWHVPDTTEWRGLLNTVDDAAALQIRGFAGMENATDASGFSAFNDAFWSSVEDGNHSYALELIGNDWIIDRDGRAHFGKGSMAYIRCIEDDKE